MEGEEPEEEAIELLFLLIGFFFWYVLSNLRCSSEKRTNEKCQMDDFPDAEVCGGCEMDKSDFSGSPVAKKLSWRKMNLKLDFSDAEEEEK